MRATHLLCSKGNSLNPLTVLGIASAKGGVVTKAAIKEAYRKKVLSAHPDAGGSPEEFERLKIAYEEALHCASRSGKVRADTGHWVGQHKSQSLKEAAAAMHASSGGEKGEEDCGWPSAEHIDENEFTAILAKASKNSSTSSRGSSRQQRIVGRRNDGRSLRDVLTGVDQSFQDERAYFGERQSSMKPPGRPAYSQPSQAAAFFLFFPLVIGSSVVAALVYQW